VIDRKPSQTYIRVLAPFTRRGFIQRIGIGAAGVLAFSLTRSGLPSIQATVTEGCRTCFGPCSSCYTASPECCSPSGLECAPAFAAVCSCSAWEQYGQFCGPPECLAAYVTVCDDGSWVANCLACC
jgi:hypothetical protein